MTIKIALQNLETKRFFQGGIAWTADAASAFDFQAIDAARRFWRENGLVRVRIVFVSELQASPQAESWVVLSRRAESASQRSHA